MQQFAQCSQRFGWRHDINVNAWCQEHHWLTPLCLDVLVAVCQGCQAIV